MIDVQTSIQEFWHVVLSPPPYELLLTSYQHREYISCIIEYLFISFFIILKSNILVVAHDHGYPTSRHHYLHYHHQISIYSFLPNNLS